MSREELAGYTLLAGYALMLALAIKVFGFRRVAMVFVGIVVVALGVAFGTLRGISARR